MFNQKYDFLMYCQDKYAATDILHVRHFSTKTNIDSQEKYLDYSSFYDSFLYIAKRILRKQLCF